MESEEPGEYFLDDYVVTEVHRLALPDRVRAIKWIIQEHGPVVTTMNLYDDFRHY